MASSSIVTCLATELARLAKTPTELEGVSAVWVFGSSLRTYVGVETDLDLLVIWDQRSMNPLAAATLRPKLSRALGDRLARRIDITLLSEVEAASTGFAEKEGAVCVYTVHDGVAGPGGP